MFPILERAGTSPGPARFFFADFCFQGRLPVCFSAEQMGKGSVWMIQWCDSSLNRQSLSAVGSAHFTGRRRRRFFKASKYVFMTLGGLFRAPGFAGPSFTVPEVYERLHAA